MRVSYNWLKKYVDLKVSPMELADKLTMAGLEVASVEYLAEGIDKVVVGKILKVEPHPNADKLVVCSVDVGTPGEPLQIVTGATNVAAGQLVPVAVVGATLPGDFKIRKANFRGLPSYGMLCSADELKINPALVSLEDREGIMSLGPDAQIGMPVTTYLGLDDYVIEIELTPNRADCLSMINVAREVAAITGSRLNLPSLDLDRMQGELPCSVEIEADDLCSRYIALMIEDIQLGPSPRWMQQCLLAAGMRPINNVVDVTNFVMLETGQPLHAFDYDTLHGRKIIVRRAKPNENMMSLDGVLRRLDPEMLVIADEDRAVGIAGVMGGLETEVTDATKTVLLESAHFDNMSIRKTARKLGLRSEASSRFEKGVNREGALFAALRAVQLMEEMGAGKGKMGIIDVYPHPWESYEITLRTKRTNQILGTDFTTQEIKNFISQLDFTVLQEEGDSIRYLIPSYRQDITREIDLIEEVARLYGYNKIPVTMPKSEMTPEQKTPLQSLHDTVVDTAAALGLTEIVSYSFINPQSFDKLNLPQEHPWRQVVQIANPLTEEQSVMRTSLLPGLLGAAERNFSRRQTALSLFEVGRVFLPSVSGPLPQERLQLGILISGQFKPGWSWPVQELDFYHLKGMLEYLIEQVLGTKLSFKPITGKPFLHPGRGAEVLYRDQVIGEMGELHPDVQENYGFSQRVYIGYLDLERIAALDKKEIRFTPIPRFPSVDRHMAVLLPEEVSSDRIGQVIREIGGSLVASYELFDVYRGPQVPAGWKSLAYGITYQDAERTLTDEEVNQLHDKIKEAIKEQLGADFR
ncbi:MAG: phenylalanine--tRNA ligase subunit beta [Clostridia bacterium]|jgi:phenylalanyl-tRNA synthetase beta chain|nr:phenylalanine--tRNA ligase subunit beta [Clostridia bacterium]